MPNLIHSLDASHLMNLINKANDVNFANIITVHDCFGTLPNNVENLRQLVTAEFVEIYSNQNFLNKFHERVLQAFSDHHFIKYIDKEGKSYFYLEEFVRLVYCFILFLYDKLIYSKRLSSSIIISLSFQVKMYLLFVNC